MVTNTRIILGINNNIKDGYLDITNSNGVLTIVHTSISNLISSPNITSMTVSEQTILLEDEIPKEEIRKVSHCSKMGEIIRINELISVVPGFNY